MTKTYFRPVRPCEKLLKSEQIPKSIKETLREQRPALDPVRLLHGIRVCLRFARGKAAWP